MRILKLFVYVGKVIDHLSVTYYFGCLMKNSYKETVPPDCLLLILSFTRYQRDALLIFTEMKV